jgi:hypothetical protein
MSKLPFLLTRLNEDIPDRFKVTTRLRRHLMRLRGHEINDADLATLDAAADSISEHDLDRIQRRARVYIERVRSASGTAHLKREEVARLIPIKDGLPAVTIETEARADEIAAGIHAQMPWMAPATEAAWHAMRRCAQDGATVFRLPPMLLIGPPGIGKSHWARALGDALRVPTTVIDAAAEAARFSVAGVQRGWGSAAPGKPVDTILTRRILNPIIIIDEIDKAGDVRSTSGTRHSLTDALLSFLEPATAARWSCPFYQIPFDMSRIGWIMTANSRRGLPDPLLSRCPPLILPPLTLADLIGFAEREGTARSLTAPALDAVIEPLHRQRGRENALSLRGRCCKTIPVKDSLRESKRLHGAA